MKRETNSGETRELTQADWNKRTRRGFLFMGASALAGLLGWRWLHAQADDQGLPWPLRSALKFNERATRGLYSPLRVDMPNKVPPPLSPVRFNGNLGLNEELDLENWRLRVEAPNKAQPLLLTRNQLSRFPQNTTWTEFRCIEGWSDFFTYSGVRFSDFLEATGVGTKSGKKYSKETPRSDLYNYVGLETPDREYYVSIDIESMLHPQTFLATEMNKVPLTEEHGAPLRLVIPVKYGIKSLKRIGRIFFSDQRPPDYWAERGYDWYAGL